VADFINGFYIRFPELEQANPTLWGTTISGFSSTITTTRDTKKKEEEDAKNKAEAELRERENKAQAQLAALARLEEEKQNVLIAKGLIAAQDALKHDELANGRYEQATKLLAEATDDIRDDSEIYNVRIPTTFADHKSPQEQKPTYIFLRCHELHRPGK
jgi:ABC-type molybdenum transport system ATPase subunit/photorepair protein PhrA